MTWMDISNSVTNTQWTGQSRVRGKWVYKRFDTQQICNTDSEQLKCDENACVWQQYLEPCYAVYHSSVMTIVKYKIEQFHPI